MSWERKEEEVTSIEPVYELVPSLNPDDAQIFERISGLLESGKDLSGFPTEVKAAYLATKQSGIPYKPVRAGEREVTKKKVTVNRPNYEVCDYGSIIIDPTCKGNIHKALFICTKTQSNLAELKATDLYSNLNKIVLDDADGSQLSQRDYEAGHKDFRFEDDPRKALDVYEYWGYWDIANDNVLVPIVIAWVGNTVIRAEENPYPDRKLPFCSAPYLPVKNSIYGEPDAELLEDSQAVLGATMRGILDIMGRSANGQVGSRKDSLDFLNRKKFDRGQHYEYNGKNNPTDIFHMHTYPEVPMSAMNLLGMQNQEAESLTGIKAFNTGINGDSLGESATGIRGVLDATSKRKLAILRRLGQMYVQIARKFISMNAVFLSEEEVIRVTNEKFVTVRRDDLAGEMDLTITIATAEEDSVQAQELAFLLQTMTSNIDPMISKMILVDIAKLRKKPDLAKKIEDYEPQPDPMQQKKAMLEIQLLEAQIRNELAKANENNANAELDRAKAITESSVANVNQSKADRDALDYVEQEEGVTQERHLQTIAAQAQGNVDLKNTEHINNLVEQSLADKKETKKGTEK